VSTCRAVTDLEVRSSGRVHDVASYCSARPASGPEFTTDVGPSLCTDTTCTKCVLLINGIQQDKKF
jgi:hypothetical protein